jgi:hypothetical protein
MYHNLCRVSEQIGKKLYSCTCVQLEVKPPKFSTTAVSGHGSSRYMHLVPLHKFITIVHPEQIFDTVRYIGMPVPISVIFV